MNKRGGSLFLLVIMGLTACSLAPWKQEPEASTSAALWAEYSRNPDRHERIPNNSFAGYRRSEVPLPEPAVVVNVRQWARADGKTDDTAAFARAIAFAEKKGGGAVLVPEGRYLLKGMIRIRQSGVVLRGEGRGKTVLHFANPLARVLGPRSPNGEKNKSFYSWAGGLIHLGPGEGLERLWALGPVRCSDLKPARRGDRSLVCADRIEPALKAGDWIFVRWAVPDHGALFDQMMGYEGFPWERDPGEGLSGVKLLDLDEVFWPVQVSGVEGRKILLDQPLRVPVGDAAKADVRALTDFISEVGVEGMTLVMDRKNFKPHNQEEGWSGLFFHRVIHGWARDLELRDVDNGLIFSASKHLTARGISVTESPQWEKKDVRAHHPFMVRSSTHDTLITDFSIAARTRHGLNVEGFSTGNVWREGVMKHGTFDSHGWMPFDILRTVIELHNDGRPGGDPAAGPPTGGRVVHWNLKLTGSARDVFQPAAIPMGALVGVRGLPVDSRPFADLSKAPPALVVDEGKEPSPPDLFRAQLEGRLGREMCFVIGCGR